MSAPRGVKVGVADEYGSIWSGEPGASEVIGDLVQRADAETMDVHLLGGEAEIVALRRELARQQDIWTSQSRMIRALQAHVPDDVRAAALAEFRDDMLKGVGDGG